MTPGVTRLTRRKRLPRSYLIFPQSADTNFAVNVPFIVIDRPVIDNLVASVPLTLSGLTT